VTAETQREALVERSRLLGADPELVLHGGGNTSAKSAERDHRGRERRVLRIKGSGADLRTVTAADFPGLYLDDLLPLRERDQMSDEEMVDYLARCLTDPKARRPSIETLLHAFLPALHVDHVHADAIVSLTNAVDGTRWVAEALGPRVAFVEYLRPGFELSKRVAAYADHEAIVLSHHGLVTWGRTSEECHARTLALVARARAYLAGRPSSNRPAVIAAELPPQSLEALLVALRRRLSTRGRCILHVERALRPVADRRDVSVIAGAGPATADHLLRVRPWSIVARDADEAVAAVDAYERKYVDYFERNRDRLPAGAAMLEPLPRVVLVPGLGAVVAGVDQKAARNTAEVALHTHRVAAEVLDVFGEIDPLPAAALFDIDYWPLELYKLTLAPAPAELSGRVVVVTGAAAGIGRTIAQWLAERGAELVLGDVDTDGLQTLAAELAAGTGRFPVVSAGDLTDPDVVEALLAGAVRTFGGIDGVVFNAGVAVTGRLAELPSDQWRRSLEVNATSHFLLTRRVLGILERQGLGGSLVYVASKNAFAPGAGFGAYSVAKAAQVQLARVAALEGGPAGIRANVVNPDAVFEGSALWSPEVRAERAAAHGVAPDQLEQYYARRNLLGAKVTRRDVAEAVMFLLSDRSARTTGCVLTVDGGVAAAFPR
jgi:rhamnulose-1-phosphate aldolase/alcohol dehydrogenase